MKQFNDDDNSSSTGAFLTGVFAGAVVGAGLALWFAPKAGVEMQKDLTDSAREIGKRVSKTVNEMSDRGREAFDRAREVVTTASDELDKATADAAKTLERGRRGMHNVANAAANAAERS